MDVEGTVTLQVGGEILLRLTKDPPAVIPIVTLTFANGFTITARGDNMAYTLPVDHYVTVQVAYVDAAGNPAQVDGDVTWDSEPQGLITLDVSTTDSKTCTLTPVGPAGVCQVTATADANLGAGVRNLVTLMAVQLVAGEAVAGTISPVGDPVPINPAA